MSMITRRGSRKESQQITHLTVSKAVGDKNPRDTYQVNIRVMFGDADFYDTLNLQFGSYELPELIDFLNFLKSEVATAYPNGRGGSDYYESVVPSWATWFGYDEHEGNVGGRFCDEWPANWDMGGEATLESVDVVYYDAEGKAFEVEANQ